MRPRPGTLTSLLIRYPDAQSGQSSRPQQPVSCSGTGEEGFMVPGWYQGITRALSGQRVGNQQLALFRMLILHGWLGQAVGPVRAVLARRLN